jgi:hypothetical protein
MAPIWRISSCKKQCSNVNCDSVVPSEYRCVCKNMHFYCSVECQKEHWGVHEKGCSITMRRTIPRLREFGLAAGTVLPKERKVPVAYRDKCYEGGLVYGRLAKVLWVNGKQKEARDLFLKKIHLMLMGVGLFPVNDEDTLEECVAGRMKTLVTTRARFLYEFWDEIAICEAISTMPVILTKLKLNPKHFRLSWSQFMCHFD